MVGEGEITVIGSGLGLRGYDVFLNGEPLGLVKKIEFVADVDDPDGTAKAVITLMPRRVTIVGDAAIEMREAH